MSRTHLKKQRFMLDGIKVVELATVIAAPTCSRMLADMGATVIKIESPGGDMFRYNGLNPKTGVTRYGAPWGTGFEQCNTGKLSVIVDLKADDGAKKMDFLLKDADVFITNVRPGALKRSGLDYDQVHKKYPRLIYGHLTAWGIGGPDEDYPGYDVGAFWAGSGLMKYSAPNDNEETPAPRFPGGLGDQTTSVHLLAGVMAALYDRERTGEGQHVEATLFRAGLWTLGQPIVGALATSTIGRELKAPSQLEFGTPTYNSYPCKGGRHMQLLGLEMPRHIMGILKAVDPEGTIRSLPQFQGDVAELCTSIATKKDNRFLFIKLLNERFLTKTVDEWETIFKAQDVWHRRVADVNEMVTDPQARAINAYSKVGDATHEIMNFPIVFSNSKAEPTTRPPLLGAHTDIVFKDMSKE